MNQHFDQDLNIGSPMPAEMKTSGGAPSAGPVSGARGPIPMRRDAWMLSPLYTAEHHIFVHRNRSILFEVHTGAFFEVDDVITDFLSACEGHSLIDMFERFRVVHGEKDVLSAYKELRDAGLVSETRHEAEAPFTPPSRLEITRIDLLVSTDHVDGSEQRPAYMTEDIGRRAVDLLVKESGYAASVHVSFVGEPLMNAALVLKLADYATDVTSALGKNVSFSVATRAAFLNERTCDELRKRNFEVQLIDTDVSAENLHGHGPTSVSPFDLRLVRADRSPRLTVSSESMADDPLTHVADVLSRFPNAERIHLDSRHLKTISDEGLEGLVDIVRDHVLLGTKTRLGEIEDSLDQVYNGRLACYRESGGVRSVAVSPDGELFVSHALAGDAQFRFGHLDTGIDRVAQRKWLRSNHVTNIPGCQSCWARYLCGGGSRSEGDGGETPDWCRATRKTYELTMFACLELAELCPDALQKRYGEGQA